MAKFAGSLDANVLLRLVLNDLPEQHEAAAKLLQTSRHPFMVSDMTLAQMVFALERHYQFKRSAIQETVEAIVSIPNIYINRALIGTALPLFVKNSSLTFEDCCLYAYAELSGAKPLWTTDKKLAGRIPGAKQVTHMDPSLSYEMV